MFSEGGNSPRPVTAAFVGARNVVDKAMDYLDLIEPKLHASDIILSSPVAGALLDVVEEYKNAETIRRHHLPIRNKLLFCGPPGCGKSVTAEALAYEVGLPILVAKLDTVIGSLLGETASNLQRIFAAIERQRAVLFLDEFDALARTRSDPGEHNEMRRVVNSLLLMIERFAGKGFVVAATNLEATIDPAIIRRFDEVIYFDKPSASDIRRLIRAKTRNFPSQVEIAERAKSLVGRSHADVERVCFTAMRRAIVDGRKTISEADFDYALVSDQRRRDISQMMVPLR